MADRNRAKKGQARGKPRAAYTPPRFLRRHFLEPLVWSPPFEDQALAATAYHEAAHALLAQVTGGNPHLVTIVPSDAGLDATLGHSRYRRFGLYDLAFSEQPRFRATGIVQAFFEIAATLAGMNAEVLWFDGGEWPDELFGLGDGGNDVDHASQMAIRLFGETDHAEQFYGQAAWWSRQTLNLRAARIGLGRLARKLHERQMIETQEEIRDCIPWVELKLPLTDAEIETWATRIVDPKQESPSK